MTSDHSILRQLGRLTDNWKKKTSLIDYSRARTFEEASDFGHFQNN